MKYLESITDFFKNPKWVTNLLFAGLCVLVAAIPVVGLVGAIVLIGWLVTGFWARTDERFETFPDFDFNHLGKYLERGLWPFLVALVTGLGLGIVLGLVIYLPLAILGALLTHGDGFISGIFGMIFSLLYLVAYIAIFAAISVIMTPLVVRASLLQDFVPSFDLPFVKKFVLMMWKESLLASLFLMVAGIALYCVGLIALCIGVVFAGALIHFAWTHLNWQLYKLYLSRGGEPVVVSPKLAAV